MPAINTRAQTPGDSAPKVRTISSAADIEKMSVEELDATIKAMRRRQEELSPVRHLDLGSSPGFDIFGGGDWEEPDLERNGWEVDAENLRGDMERVGLDMWIALLRTVRARKSA